MHMKLALVVCLRLINQYTQQLSSCGVELYICVAYSELGKLFIFFNTFMRKLRFKLYTNGPVYYHMKLSPLTSTKHHLNLTPFGSLFCLNKYYSFVFPWFTDKVGDVKKTFTITDLQEQFSFPCGLIYCGGGWQSQKVIFPLKLA